MSLEAICTSLGAYAETLSALNTLRLCNRFCRGPKCAINKLPVELVRQIEGYVAEPALLKHQDLLASTFRCLEDRCDIRDHLDKEEIIEFWQEANQDSGEPSDDESSRYCVLRTIDDGDQHTYKQEAAGGKIHAFLDQYRPFMRRNFGLDILNPHVRLDPDGRGFKQTIVAYLTLPGVTMSKSWSRKDLDEYDHTSRTGEQAIAMPIAMTKQPTLEDLEKIPRAIKVLGLVVLSYESE